MEAVTYPEGFEEKIGFSQVREMLLQECLSETGRGIIRELGFSASPDVIRTSLGRTAEFMAILQEGLPFPAQDYLDLVPVLHRLRTPGSFILTEELHDLRTSLSTILAAVHFLQKADQDKLPLLKALASEIDIPNHILPAINRLLDEKGEVRDNASPALSKIRKEIRSKLTASEKLIHSLLVKARDNGWVSQDAEPTLRDGRLVLPIQAAHKRRIRGLVHDESATGHTVYLEPDECLELNNEVRNLENAEKREITRILSEFTNSIRPELYLLVEAHHWIGTMDAIRSQARFSLRIGACVPILHDKPLINWNTARHPLLFLSHLAKGRKIVPLDIRLQTGSRILVISGPNAGGKSVCLKTVGLLQYMLQCGLPVPMDSSSKAGIFKKVFLEIGDEQSLEDDLSTYSSHLLHIRHFVGHSDPTTLFLIDEFGSGTDPSLGGAIAEAALEKLSERGAYGVVTTHYSNLKTMAGKVDGITNGAMLFDTAEMKPLYQLKMGHPGSSFTYEIAQKIGFPEEVIERAISKTGRTHLDFERQLQELEVEKRRMEKRKEEFTVADDFLSELIDRYEKMQADLERTRKEILEKARQEASDLLGESNRLIERTIREIRESQAEKERTKAVRKELERQKEKVRKGEGEKGRRGEGEKGRRGEGEKGRRGEEEKGRKEEKETARKGELSEEKQKIRLREGNWVKIIGQERVGRIHRISGKKAVVDFNGIRFTIDIQKLEHCSPPKEEVHFSRSASGYAGDLSEKTAQFRLTLDLRGKMAEEALQLVRRYLDDAYLLRIREVSILHGKGEGILRKVIRELLASAEEVESFEDEHIERGGSGITRVVIK
jgi:DNA mismatch repair protein MutS2